MAQPIAMTSELVMVSGVAVLAVAPIIDVLSVREVPSVGVG
jgi:hypothetical protein